MINLSEHIGQNITVQGKAYHQKSGAIVMVDQDYILLENVGNWPDDFHSKVDVEVTGTLEYKMGAPAVSESGEIQQGYPTPTKIYFFKDAVWKKISE
ncbi:MAG: hypothetical protein HOE90_13215 [Bacteriovoracaceae bacterium]|nr:hypothetical protein [Bacteriovoracaceae bacterium]